MKGDFSMTYDARFNAVTSTGNVLASPSIGGAYALLRFADGDTHSGVVLPDFPKDRPVRLFFTRVEDVIYDLCRIPQRDTFCLTRWLQSVSDDGEINRFNESKSMLDLSSLQEFLIVNYGKISLPIVLTLNRGTGGWCYSFSFDYREFFHIT